MTGRKPKKARLAVASENRLTAANPPEWLNPTAREIWARTLTDLEAGGREIPVQFVETLAAYATSAAAVRDADAALQRDGMTVRDGRQGTRRHPCVAIRSQAILQVRLLAESLGLTPGASGRLPTTRPSADREASEEIRRKDPHGYAQFVKEHGRPPTNIYEVL